MIRQWSQKLERNLLRTKYYDGRNELKNLSIAVPDSMAGISEVVGWPQKSVDALADRIVFDGFVGVGDDSRDPLGLDSILSDNDFDVELPQAIRSALTHSCSFLNVRSAEPEDGLRSKVSVSFRSALYETGLWDYARRGLSAALSITDIDRSQYAQANTIVPSELMLYMPGYTIRIRRTQSGRYHADAPRNTYMDHVPVYLIPYHQDLNRPFGRSRISREVMSITDTAVRTMLRMEVSAEFYSSPQRYLIGADEPPEDKNGKKLTGWEATISKDAQHQPQRGRPGTRHRPVHADDHAAAHRHASRPRGTHERRDRRAAQPVRRHDGFRPFLVRRDHGGGKRTCHRGEERLPRHRRAATQGREGHRHPQRHQRGQRRARPLAGQLA
jgi:hypothetical protein